MAAPGYLVLEDGSVFEGEPFGAPGTVFGEVVFNTSMTGYQEVLTDPSYAGQIVVLTYPLVGNYGINDRDFESGKIRVAGLIVREHCDRPSHGEATKTLHEFLASQGIPAISGVDTRALTRHLRSRGVMMGMVTTQAPEEALARLAELPSYDGTDFVSTVTTQERYQWDSSAIEMDPEAKYRILVTDCGLKFNILRLLKQRGCQVIALPATTPPEDMLALNPSGCQRGQASGPGAADGHLLGTSDNRPGPGRRYLQAQVWASGRQPPSEGPSHRTGLHNGPKPWLCRRGRLPWRRLGDFPHQPE